MLDILFALRRILGQRADDASEREQAGVDILALLCPLLVARRPLATSKVD